MTAALFLCSRGIETMNKNAAAWGIVFSFSDIAVYNQENKSAAPLYVYATTSESSYKQRVFGGGFWEYRIQYNKKQGECQACGRPCLGVIAANRNSK